MGLRDPLVPPLVALALGVAAARYGHFEPREAALAFGAQLGIALLAWKCAGRRLAGAAALAAVFHAGALRQSWRPPAPEPPFDLAQVQVLTGCVVEPPSVSDERQRYAIEVAPGLRVRMTAWRKPGEQLPPLDSGQLVQVEARLRRPRNYHNEGGFDFVKYLARQQVHWTATQRPGTRLQVLSGDCGSAWRAGIYRLRTAALRRLAALYADDPYALAVAQATLVGDAARLERAWAEQFRRTGTYHALVISGLHLTTLAACFLFLLRLCAAGVGTSLVLTAAAGWIYAVLAGGNPPVVRAAAGLTLYLLCRYFHRRRRLVNLLAAVAIGFLLIDPEQLFDSSFHLSFLAVAMIGAVAVPLLEGSSQPYAHGLRNLAVTERDPHLPPRIAEFRIELRLLAETFRLLTRIPKAWWLAAFSTGGRIFLFGFELAVVAVIVQLGMALPMIDYFHRFSVSGFSANVVVVFLMNLVVPLGFATILTGWAPLAGLTHWFLDASRKAAEWHSGWEPNWRVPDPPLWLGAVFLMALLLVAVRPRRTSFALLTAACCLVIWHPFPPEQLPGVLELTALDVGQGEALFVALPDGRRMLVDGGGIPSFGRRAPATLDIGEDVVSAYLWSRSIRGVDVVVATHAHEDHVGGLPALIENFRPRELWLGVEPEGRAWQALNRSALRSRVRLIRRRAGERFAWGGAGIEVLAPPLNHRPRASAMNNDSLVLRITHGGHSFLLTGDIERSIEGQLAAAGDLRADVLKVAHHGSRTSTGPEFLSMVRPAFAVISDGLENSYGFPHSELLERLHGRNIAVLRTDQLGRITIRSDGKRLLVESYCWPVPACADARGGEN